MTKEVKGYSSALVELLDDIDISIKNIEDVIMNEEELSEIIKNSEKSEKFSKILNLDDSIKNYRLQREKLIDKQSYIKEVCKMLEGDNKEQLDVVVSLLLLAFGIVKEDTEEKEEN